MYATLARMPEHCDPYIYYHRVRPYIHGWKNNPALPKGVIYEGVADYGGAPQFFRGETGAQSAVIPALDALFGIQHEEDPLKTYLMEMRYYMPVRHRRFIEAIEQGPSLRNYLGERKSDFGRLIELYNRCVSGIERFRSLHLEYAATYIYRQGRISPTNPANVGTGGTPFMRYLRKHRDETVKHQL
jgi:indoleamine 2,3-dioxygenase